MAAAAREEREEKRNMAMMEMVERLSEANEQQKEQLRVQAEQMERVITQLADSNTKNMEAQNARQVAGESPKFKGNRENIAVWNWLLAYDYWCMAMGYNTAREKLKYVQTALVGDALTWYAEEQARALKENRARVFDSWEELKTAMTKEFLIQEPAEWARTHMRALTLSRENNKNITKYTNEYNAYNAHLKDRSEEDRMFDYKLGLPLEYEREVMKKQCKTVKEMTDIAIRQYNHSIAAGKQSGRVTPTVNNVEMDEMDDAASTISNSSTSTSTSSTQPTQASLVNEVARLTKMMTEMTQYMQGGNNNNRSRGGYSGGSNFRGRQRGRGGGSQGDNNNSGRGRSRSLTAYQSMTKLMWDKYGIHRDVVQERMDARQCVKCAEDSHRAVDCKNAAKN